MTKNFESILGHAVRCLEQEDKYLRSKNILGNQEKSPGILRMMNERYYQFLIWREMIKYNFVQLEWKSHDLAIFDSHESKPGTIIEMKHWFSESGLREIPGIRTDLSKLEKCGASAAGLMVFSANPLEETVRSVEFLEKAVFIDRQTAPALRSGFSTVNAAGSSVEFWIGIWIIKSPTRTADMAAAGQTVRQTRVEETA